MQYYYLFARTGAVLLSVLLLIPVVTVASSLNLEHSSDDTGSDDTHLDLSLDLPISGTVYGSYGQSKLSETNGVNLDTTDYSLGIETDPLADFGVGVEGSYWGQSGSLEIVTKQVNLFANTHDAAFMVSPRVREIYVFTAGLLSKFKDSVTVESQGAEFSADYYGVTPWSFGVSWLTNDYDKNVSALASDPRLLLLLSPSTLILASGFESHRTTLRTGYSFDWGSIELEAFRSHSAVDGSNANYRSITLYCPSDKDWQLYLGYGKQSQDTNSDDVVLTRIGLTWNW